MALPLDVKAGILLVSIIALHWLKHRRDIRLPLPPGPRKLPLVGNVFQLPPTYEWVTYHNWARELKTDILHLELFGKSVIVLDSAEAANELLEKRSSIYSSRARHVMTNELMGWDFHFVTMPYGDQWRKHRRLMQQSFNANAATKFHPAITKATHNFLRRLLRRPEPEDIIADLRHLAGATIVRITYGLDVKETDDPYIEAAENGFRPFSIALIPSQFWVNFAPALKYLPEWIPGASFLKKAKEWKKWTERMLNFPYEALRDQMKEGTAPKSFASEALERIDPTSEDRDSEEYLVKSTAGTLYAAGSDTTVAVMSSCILGLLEHPEVVRRAQRDIDEVTGSERLPTLDDMKQLPYITAIIKETMRWRDVVPIAVPHYNNVEDVYNGYRIPAGSTIIPNAWAMLHDPETYHEPFTFNPDRFIGDDGGLDFSVKDPDFAVWGFGRRICPGRYMGFSASWIAIASLLAVFDLQKPVDKNGNVVELSHEYGPSSVMLPLPYRFVLKPRSKTLEDLVMATAES